MTQGDHPICTGVQFVYWIVGMMRGVVGGGGLDGWAAKLLGGLSEGRLDVSGDIATPEAVILRWPTSCNMRKAKSHSFCADRKYSDSLICIA